MLPLSMLLIYPSTTLEKKFTRSYLKGIKDSIITVVMLYFCKQAYIGLADETVDSLDRSPILLGNKTIQGVENQLYDKWAHKWPRTTLMVGERDPLLDDSLRFF